MKKYLLPIFVFLSGLLTAATTTQTTEDQLKVSLYDITGENNPKEITNPGLSPLCFDFSNFQRKAVR